MYVRKQAKQEPCPHLPPASSLVAHLVAQEVSVDVVPVGVVQLLLAVNLRALLVLVHDELELRGRVGVAVLASDLCVEGVVAVGGFLELDALCKSKRGQEMSGLEQSLEVVDGRVSNPLPPLFPEQEDAGDSECPQISPNQVMPPNPDSPTKQTHVQKSHVSGQVEVVAVRKRLVVEVRPHEVRDGHDVRSHVLEVAVERAGLLEELELDHVSVVAV